MKTDEFAITLLLVHSEQNPFIIKTEKPCVFQLVVKMSFNTDIFQALCYVYK